MTSNDHDKRTPQIGNKPSNLHNMLTNYCTVILEDLTKYKKLMSTKP